MMLQPRFDSAALARTKTRIKSMIRQNSVDPRSIAMDVTGKLLYGSESTLALDAYGTAESVDSITMDDVKAFYNANYSPSISSFTIAGAIDQKETEKILASLVEKWKAKDVTIPEPKAGVAAKAGTIYFVDYPNAPQSTIVVSKTSMPVEQPRLLPCRYCKLPSRTRFSGNVV